MSMMTVQGFTPYTTFLYGKYGKPYGTFGYLVLSIVKPYRTVWDITWMSADWWHLC